MPLRDVHFSCHTCILFINIHHIIHKTCVSGIGKVPQEVTELRSSPIFRVARTRRISGQRAGGRRLGWTQEELLWRRLNNKHLLFCISKFCIS